MTSFADINIELINLSTQANVSKDELLEMQANEYFMTSAAVKKMNDRAREAMKDK